MATRDRTMLLWLSRLLLALGVVCLSLWGALSLRGALEGARHERRLERLLDERFVVAPLERAPAARGDDPAPIGKTSPPSAQPIRPPRPQDPGERRLVGRIDIPSARVQAVILEGTDDEALRGGVGHFPETPLPHEGGNVALAGHRDSHFRGLRQVNAGDEIVLTTPHGTFRYAVQWMRVVEPHEVHVLRPSPDHLLTLVTCFPFDHVGPAPRRYVVRAQRADGTRVADADGSSRAQLGRRTGS